MRQGDSSSDIEEIGLLIKRGNRWIEDHRNGMPLFELEDEAVAYDKVLANLRQSQLRLVGRELVCGTLFDRIGYEVHCKACIIVLRIAVHSA